MTDKIQATCSPVTGNALGFLPVVGNDCPVDPSSEDEGGSELVTCPLDPKVNVDAVSAVTGNKAT